MSGRSAVTVIVTLVALSAVYFALRATGEAPAAPGGYRAYRLRIQDYRLISSPAVLPATEGDSVTLTVWSNRSATLHVHEYEQHMVFELQSEQEAAHTFVADRAGRFPVHLLGQDGTFAELGALEVQPR